MAKSVLDAGWFMLKTQLSYKAKGQEVEFLEVNEADSTQSCSCCGAQHDRDIKAARNILNLGFGCKAPVDGIPAL
jgi:transposase